MISSASDPGCRSPSPKWTISGRGPWLHAFASVASQPVIAPNRIRPATARATRSPGKWRVRLLPKSYRTPQWSRHSGRSPSTSGFGTSLEILSRSAKKSATHNCMRRPTAPAARLKKTALAEALQIGLVEEIQNLLGAEAVEDLDFEALETAVRHRALRIAARALEQ